METVEILYTAGKAGIKPGGGIRFTMMHLHRWTPFQAEDPNTPGYISAKAPSGVKIKTKYFINRSWKEILSSYEWRLYDPYYNYVEYIVEGRGLKPGETIHFVLGDKSKGSKGVFTQYFTEDKFVFETYIDPTGDGVFYPFADAEHPRVELINSDTYKINIVNPTNAIVGKPTWTIIRAEDKHGNPAKHFSGTIDVYEKGESNKLFTHTFSEDDEGSFRIHNVIFHKEGVVNLVAKYKDWSVIGNPIIVEKTAPAEKIFWGDIHNHTKFSDGRGTFKQSYKYGRDFAGLDFCAISDHAQNLKDFEWEACKKVTNAFNKSGEFVTFHCYEWSGKEDVGGDHNVYFYDDEIPIYRSRANFNYLNFNNYQGKEMQMNHIEDLYIALMRHYTKKNIIVIPHYGGRHGNPEWHYPVLERNIEIFSDHRRSEDWVTTFLTKGHRLGIMASSDNHVGKPGYSITFPKHKKPTNSEENEKFYWEKEEIGTSLIATYAPEHTRESIFEAMYDRRSYATTGARIVLDFLVNGNPMGSEIECKKSPIIKIKVIGTDVIERIEIKKNSEVIHTKKPGKIEVEFEWEDSDFNSDDTAYYYVRVVQKDKEEAVSSPIWVN